MKNKPACLRPRRTLRWPARLTAVACAAVALGTPAQTVTPLATADTPAKDKDAVNAKDDATCDDACGNRRIGETWSQLSGQPSPTIAADITGARRLEWRGTLGVRAHGNRVEAGAPGSANTATQGGRRHTASLRSEWTLTESPVDAPASTTPGRTLAQLAAQAGDDRALMPEYGSQVQNVSIAHQSADWSMQVGDHAAAFSPLGFQLGYRGVHAQREIAGVKASVIAGTLAESWDSLANRDTRSGRPARSRYLRDVTALHLERGSASHWHAFAALGVYRDRGTSVVEAMQQVPVLAGRSLATGLRFRDEPFTFAIEWANSQVTQHEERRPDSPVLVEALLPSDEDEEAKRQVSQALTIDASYRFSQGQIRAGARRIGSTFGAASATVQPGSEEVFVAADWSPTTWLQTTADLRGTALRPALAMPSAGAGKAHTRRAALGATAMLSAWVQGLSLNAQGSWSEQSTPAGPAPGKQAQASAGAQWQHALVNVGVTVVENIARTPAAPSAASNTTGAQLQLAVPFGQPRGGASSAGHGSEVPITSGWAGQATLTAGAQHQTLLQQGASARNRSLGVAMQAGREGIGQFTASLQQQTSEPPSGGGPIRQRQFQLDGQRPVAKDVDLKLTARWAWHNLGSAVTFGRERTLGAELQTRW